ncbi:hypothetical protein G7046_g9387 [Stylonectria norvegica]|nr:hypothetical protein G7046_g9387 [Stylonectria norvegica]
MAKGPSWWRWGGTLAGDDEPPGEWTVRTVDGGLELLEPLEGLLGPNDGVEMQAGDAGWIIMGWDEERGRERGLERRGSANSTQLVAASCGAGPMTGVSGPFKTEKMGGASKLATFWAFWECWPVKSRVAARVEDGGEAAAGVRAGAWAMVRIASLQRGKQCLRLRLAVAVELEVVDSGLEGESLVLECASRMKRLLMVL